MDAWISSDPNTLLSRVRIALVGLAGVALAIGLVTLVAPVTAEYIPITPIMAVFEHDWVVVAVVGLVALVGVLGMVVARAVVGINQITPPNPEGFHRVPHDGAEFDEFLSTPEVRSLLSTDRHRDVRSRLRAAAISTVMRESNCPRGEAVDRVDDGTWTDNDAAATFLVETDVPPLATRIAGSLLGASHFQRAARTTAIEIARHDPEGEQ